MLTAFVSTTLTVMVLLLPFLFASSKLHKNAMTAVKFALLFSLVPILFTLIKGPHHTAVIAASYPWFKLLSTFLAFWVRFDMYQVIFLPIAVFASWSILQFSTWYMADDPKMNKFSAHLILFLVSMIIFISAGNLILIFLGWEAIGMMSFLLIGWYNTRHDAAMASLMAILYNRIGDMGLLFSVLNVFWLSGWADFDSALFQLPSESIAVGFTIAAASKSAQFMFHPWLISAMEGPTPVSALLHSSTMVVAGIFLLLRIHPHIAASQFTISLCLCLGAITSAFAAWSATKQNDMKKIIALSTSSQLGLMMIAIGLNLPVLAFFHMSTHAFFKALLFLCSGVVIHNLSDNQDIRRMGGLLKSLPITATCMTLASLALMGTPYLVAFFSKDAIIEAAANSYVNTFALLLALVATSCSTLYSVRMIYAVFLRQPRSVPLINFVEPSFIKYSLVRLALGSIVMGLLLFNDLFPRLPDEATLPSYLKWAALLISASSFLVAITFSTRKSYWSLSPQEESIEIFYADPAPTLSRPVHDLVANMYLYSAWEITTYAIDRAYMNFIGLAPPSQLPPIKLIHQTQKGLIQMYLAALFISLVLVITFLFFFA
uniref:NADH-ubiquinone oxidoreductase chain 5 n=1 Tax=Minervarya manoharani TaxID=3372176 RepID=A0A343L6N5_9NEOB|nr:NADH dehydrogenase subunit 5 [Fejervarya manoharani]